MTFKPKAFEVLVDSKLQPKAVKGSVVYDFWGCDYGLANDDTRAFDIEHVSVTFDENGGTPSFTIPRRDLQEIKL